MQNIVLHFVIYATAPSEIWQAISHQLHLPLKTRTNDQIPTYGLVNPATRKRSHLAKPTIRLTVTAAIRGTVIPTCGLFSSQSARQKLPTAENRRA
jgi:hypothetical protein